MRLELSPPFPGGPLNKPGPWNIFMLYSKPGVQDDRMCRLLEATVCCPPAMEMQWEFPANRYVVSGAFGKSRESAHSHHTQHLRTPRRRVPPLEGWFEEKLLSGQIRKSSLSPGCSNHSAAGLTARCISTPTFAPLPGLHQAGHNVLGTRRWLDPEGPQHSRGQELPKSLQGTRWRLRHSPPSGLDMHARLPSKQLQSL